MTDLFDRDAYHSSGRLSWSKLKVFMGNRDSADDGARDYFERFVVRSREPDPPTKAMILGTLANRILLECGRHKPTAARCGVIPIRADTRGSDEYRVVGEAARRLLAGHGDAEAAGEWILSFPQAARAYGYHSVPVIGKDTKAYREGASKAAEDDLEPIRQFEWGAALEYVQELVRDDPAAVAAGEVRLSPMAVLSDWWEQAQEIAGAVRKPQTPKAEAANAILLGQAGDSEVPLHWMEEVDVDEGAPVLIPCQGLVDRVSRIWGPAWLWDLKTAKDPAPGPRGFDAGARRFDYFGQLAMYRRGWRAVHGEDVGGCGLIPAGSEPPYAVDVRPVTAADLDRAESRIEDALQALAERIRGIKPWCASWEAEDEFTDIEDWKS